MYPHVIDTYHYMQTVQSFSEGNISQLELLGWHIYIVVEQAKGPTLEEVKN